MALQPAQEEFCQRFIVHRVGARAYFESHPKCKSENAAAVGATHSLKNPKIRARIDELDAERIERTQITADSVVQAFARIANKAEDSNDFANANRANENLGKHLGVFERDNRQKVQSNFQLVLHPEPDGDD
jgi:hypothetical protein